MTVLGSALLRQFAADHITGGNPSIQPASIDLTLAEELILPSNGFALGATSERVRVPVDLLGELCGKSSIARLGVMVECAGLVDPGWDGVLTLEIKNLRHYGIRLVAGLAICQLKLSRVEGCDMPYAGRYQGATTVEGWKEPR